MRFSILTLTLSTLAWPCFALAQRPAENPRAETPRAETPATENPAAQKAIDLATQRGIDWLARRQCANCHFSVPDSHVSVPAKTTAAAFSSSGDLLTQQATSFLRLAGKKPDPCLRDDEKHELVTYLGVSLAAVPAAVRRHVKLPAQMGLLVETVDVGSPAQAAGVARHDVLLQIDEQWLVNPEQFTALVRTFQPAAEVKLTAIQRNETRTLTATLASRQAQAANRAKQYGLAYLSQLHAAHSGGKDGWKSADIAADFDGDGHLDVLLANQHQAEAALILGNAGEEAAAPRKKIVAYLGVHTASPPEALAKQLRLAPGLALIIETVEENTAAAKAGLKPFDVLQKLDDQFLVNGDQFTVLIRSHKPGDEVRLALIREGKPQAVRVALGQIDTEVAADDSTSEVHARFANVALDGNLVSRRILADWLTTGENARLADATDAEGGNDAEFLRRTYLDLLGILPTPEEAKAFVEDSDKLKRKKLIDSLLSRPEAISRTSGSWAVKWNDAEHSLALVSKDGARHLTVWRMGNLGHGKAVFDGPVDTPQQQEALPEDVAGKLAVMLKSQPTGPPQAAPAADLLERVLPRIELVEAPLKQALAQLREQTGANLVVNWKALKQAGISADEPITLTLRDVRASTALSTLLALASDDKARLGYTLDGEVILISVKGK